MGGYVWLAVVGFVAYMWWSDRQKTKVREATEALQQPALRDDERDWTELDQLVLDVARHDELARWHAEGRQMFRDTPVRSRDVDDGWEVFVDEWGSNITGRYEQLFPELRMLSRKKREAVLHVAMEKSAAARANLRLMKIANPDGSVHELPLWMG